jgi:superfamily II DNA helicase RecQ
MLKHSESKGYSIYNMPFIVRKVLQDLHAGWMRVVFSGPKFILNNQDICDNIDALPAAGCRMDKIVIGEVYCVPHWGGNFCPLYKELGDHLRAFVNVPMYATTATLQEHHQKEVQDMLPYDKDSTLASQSRIEGKPV